MIKACHLSEARLWPGDFSLLTGARCPGLRRPGEAAWRGASQEEQPTLALAPRLAPRPRVGGAGTLPAPACWPCTERVPLTLFGLKARLFGARCAGGSGLTGFDDCPHLAGSEWRRGHVLCPGRRPSVSVWLGVLQARPSLSLQPLAPCHDSGDGALGAFSSSRRPRADQSGK